MKPLGGSGSRKLLKGRLRRRAGLRHSAYDLSTGQILYTQNSVLIEKGQKITYSYDEFGRIKKIIYPDKDVLDETVYEYDANDQIVHKTDNSGEYTYVYGKLGELCKETVTLKQYTNSQTQQQYRTAQFSYLQNYLGQMEEITYPNGEVVTYSYTNGGNVCRVQGKLCSIGINHTFDYVKNITYDHKDRRTSIEYGNGIISNYTYDEYRGWLETLVTTDSLKNSIQNIEYRFDVTGNVISYTNECTKYSTTQEYQYDTLGQLIQVNGKSVCQKYSSGPEYVSTYSQNWQFDSLGRQTLKESSVQNRIKTDLGGDLLNYRFDYEYLQNKANQVETCGGMYYAYDSNGNMILEQNAPVENANTGYVATVTKIKQDTYSVDQAWGFSDDTQATAANVSRRIFDYNCKNEMIVSKDSRYYTRYTYNQEGKRTGKYSSLGETLYFNDYAAWTYRPGDVSNPDGHQDVHIMLLGQRIVTKQNSATRYELADQIDKQYWYHTNHIG
ncbi:MAG: hypothetical protein HUJ58_09215, partial [Erysipelotrichaceae bacterium]|nr:hypothetical protein [Erysipelotrichaceae bacterium]